MKARNGGHGMSEMAVKQLVPRSTWSLWCTSPSFRFVDRYIPGYVFFGDPPPVVGRPPKSGLVLCLDEAREVTDIGYL